MAFVMPHRAADNGDSVKVDEQTTVDKRCVHIEYGTVELSRQLLAIVFALAALSQLWNVEVARQVSVLFGQNPIVRPLWVIFAL